MEVLGPCFDDLLASLTNKSLEDVAIDLVFEDVFAAVAQHMQHSLALEKVVADLIILDSKSFALLVKGRKWLSLDSHYRSVSGKLETTSLTTCGLVTANLFHTLGEVMRRGGSEAAYTTISRGGAWAVYRKGALATACTAPTDSRPPVQSLLQPATSSENLDRDSTHSTEL